MVYSFRDPAFIVLIQIYSQEHFLWLWFGKQQGVLGALRESLFLHYDELFYLDESCHIVKYFPQGPRSNLQYKFNLTDRLQWDDYIFSVFFFLIQHIYYISASSAAKQWPYWLPHTHLSQRRFLCVHSPTGTHHSDVILQNFIHF